MSEKLYQMRLQDTSFFDSQTGFSLAGGEQKPLPRRLSPLIRDWIRANGIVPVPESKSAMKPVVPIAVKKTSEYKDLAASVGMSVEDKPLVEQEEVPPPKVTLPLRRRRRVKAD